MSGVAPGAYVHKSKPVACVSEGNVRIALSDQKKKGMKIRASLFFDGTRNNRENTCVRLHQNNPVYGEIYQRNTDHDEASYEGYYTNIHFLNKFVDIDATGDYYKYITIYVEGVGTKDRGKDDVRGEADAIGPTGIKKMIKKSINILTGNIKTSLGPTNPQKKIEVEEIRLDVFGFSRGAACARYFVYTVLNDNSINIKKAFDKALYNINNVKVYFVGLFDTVSTYWIKGLEDSKSNVKELKLDAIENAKSAFHIVSSDEHRRWWALTNIKSAVRKGIGKEIVLPGVHSDIGGGYTEQVEEKFEVTRLKSAHYPFKAYKILFDPSKEKEFMTIENELNKLINEGWFRKTDLFRKEGNNEYYLDKSAPIRAAINNKGAVWVRRAGIGNSYSRIPLHMMVEKATEEGILFLKNFSTKPETGLEEGLVSAEIRQVNELLKKYAKSVTNEIVLELSLPLQNDLTWKIPLPLLRKLQLSYLHFSATYKEVAKFTPYQPRYTDKDNRIRKRQIHDG